MDEDGNTALHYACSENQGAIAELLLKKNASPNIQDTAGWTSFHAAASARHFNICQLLLRHQADPSLSNNSNSSGFAYLGRAVGSDPTLQMEVIRECVGLREGLLDARNDLGETILHVTALRASPVIVSCLLDLSSDPNLVNM